MVMEVFADSPITIVDALTNRLRIKNEDIVSFLYLKVINKSRKYVFHLSTVHLQTALFIFSVHHRRKKGVILSMVVGSGKCKVVIEVSK